MNSTHPTREEVARLINEQLDGRDRPTPEKQKWHYGKVELRAVMDLIYGGPPKSDAECIGKGLQLRNVTGKRT